MGQPGEPPAGTTGRQGDCIPLGRGRLPGSAPAQLSLLRENAPALKGPNGTLTSAVPGAKLLFIICYACYGSRLRGRGIAGAIIVDLGHANCLPCRDAAVAALPALA
jgi:hypothetical protein